MLTIAVCAKQVVDPEAPLSLFEIAPDGKNLVPPPGTPPVLSAFDENALEAALRLKDTVGAKVTVLSLGNKLAKPVLKKTIAAGADELILLEDEAFEALDSAQTARTLARAIEKLGGVDLILCGRQAADTDAGQVGISVAALLDLPAVTVARKVDVADGKVRVERVTADGYEVVEAALPALVTASNEIGELRFPAVRAIMAAQKVQPTIWSAADLGLDLAGAARMILERYYVPDRSTRCEMITGETPGDIADGVVQILKTRIV
jgi:electron transfer flavoprotein beta subunit